MGGEPVIGRLGEHVPAEAQLDGMDGKLVAFKGGVA